MPAAEDKTFKLTFANNNYVVLLKALLYHRQ